MKMKCVLVNEGLSTNIGDQAIMKSAINMFTQLNYECLEGSFSINPNTKGSIKIRNKVLRYIYWKSYLIPLLSHLVWFISHGVAIRRSIKKKSSKADIVVIGGGELVQSNGYFSTALLMWTILAKYYYRCPLLILGVTVRSNITFYDKYIIKYCLMSASQIYVRDKISIANSKEIFNIDASYIPDFAYSLNIEYDHIQKYDNQKLKLLLICFMDYDHYVKISDKYISKEEYYLKYYQEAKNYFDRNYQITISYTANADKKESQDFSEYLNKSLITNYFFEYKNLKDFQDFLEKTSVVFSARMHALIIGLNFGCSPLVDDCSEKLKGFKIDISESNILDKRSQASSTLKSIVKKSRWKNE